MTLLFVFLVLRSSFNPAATGGKASALAQYPRYGVDQEAALDWVYQARAESLLSVDDLVGSAISTLEATGQLDNTCVCACACGWRGSWCVLLPRFVFTSDLGVTPAYHTKFVQNLPGRRDKGHEAPAERRQRGEARGAGGDAARIHRNLTLVYLPPPGGALGWRRTPDFDAIPLSHGATDPDLRKRAVAVVPPKQVRRATGSHCL